MFSSKSQFINTRSEVLGQLSDAPLECRFGLGKESWLKKRLPLLLGAGGMIVHDFSIFFLVGMNVNLSAFHCFDRTMSLESGR